MLDRFPRHVFLGLFACSMIVACKPNTPGGEEAGDPLKSAGLDDAQCKRTVVAEVAIIEQTLVYNRMGATQAPGLMFALARDVQVSKGTGDRQWLIDTPEWQTYETCRKTGDPCLEDLRKVSATYSTNQTTQQWVQLREDRRPRPLALRANVNDCLEVNVVNLLPTDPTASTGAVDTNYVGFHPVGMPLVSSSDNDGQIVGKNRDAVTSSTSGSAPTLPTNSTARQYLYLANEEAVHFVSSTTDDNDAQLNAGLFGAVHVQPEGAEYYRSQVTEQDLRLATTGTNPDGTPQIKYQATYPAAAPAGDLPLPPWKGEGTPILSMLRPLADRRVELIYSDLTAIITGPDTGQFTGDSPSFNPNPASPNRRDPYREFTIIYHEPGGIAQAFPTVYNGQATTLPDGSVFNPPPGTTTEAGKDLFGINYGTGGIGSEIIANRFGLGPMADCATCRYEEFFLSSWTVGDPAMNVDMSASNIVTLAGVPGSGAADLKAQVAYYPDDPSNVYHSYIGDHVKMRVHHGGAIHHLHHLHAHQWLHSPNSDEGHYLDSQLIGPASSFTTEITYGGSGNRNQTVGDSIFHCHFYPHFAEGMWAMWRVHDVYEAGTKLEPKEFTYPFETKPKTQLVPAAGSRALPDGEIDLGTPIPGLVPVPHRPIAPLPSEVYIADGQVNYGKPGDPPDRWGTSVKKNPGYPFFIPGQAGERAPQPPLDIAMLDGKPLDGGLPRHVVIAGTDIVNWNNRYDWSRFSNSLTAIALDEQGTPVEKVAMEAHAVRDHKTYTPEGKESVFVYNGMKPQAGAPFADPCYDVDAKCLADNGGDPTKCAPQSVVSDANPMRHYRAADIQHDTVLNKDGWHHPQQRMPVLWNDIQPTFSSERPPQPFFFRANSNQCIEFWLTNLVPAYYELDNFEVRTPTDILGQHIHLVKFDVTSSDGAANGWNYEDGTLSYEEVVDRIESINKGGGLRSGLDDTVVEELKPEVPQYLCDAGVDKCEQFTGAMTTVQRWWADPLLNESGQDRTIRTVFTHDHFGPSTHQQAGLYAGLLVEHTGTKWYDAENQDLELGANKNADGTPRQDGGPTSWQAVIVDPTNADNSFREFALEFQDLALAYEGGGTYKATKYPDKNHTATPDQVASISETLNGTATSEGAKIRKYVGGFIYDSKDSSSSKPIAAPEGPQLISAAFNGIWGTYGVNYRHEPLAMRASGAGAEYAPCPDGQINCDSAYLYQSIERAQKKLNSQHVGEPHYPPALTSGVYDWDPFTPMLRAYEGERVQIRTLVGAHLQMHNFMTHGFAWLFEPSNKASGYRDSQSMGISEHFEMEFRMPPATRVAVPDGAGKPTETCGQPVSADQKFTDYLYTPTSTIAGQVNGNWGLIRSYAKGTAQCLTEVPGTPAVAPKWSCPDGAPKRAYVVAAYNTHLTYNDRDHIDNPHALIYTACEGEDCTPTPPVTCSADCASPCTKDSNDQCKPPPVDPLVLRAAAGECVNVKLVNNFDATKPVFTDSDTSLVATSADQLLGGLPPSFFADSESFAAVTANPSSTVGLHPQLLAYDGVASGLNVGFDPLATAAPGESVDYSWYAGIIEADGSGRPVEFGVVNLLSTDPLLQSGFGLVGALVVEPAGSSWDSSIGTVATVTTADATSFRDLVLITTDGVAAYVQETVDKDVTDNAVTIVLVNYGTEPIAERFEGAGAAVNKACQYSNALVKGDPKTPVMTAEALQPTRLRVVHPWGNDQQVFELFGHLWAEEPYNRDSTVLGDINPLSNYQGFREGWGATNRLDVVVDAGGPNGVVGDYLYRLRDVNLQATNGAWGLFRVGDVTVQLAPECVSEIAKAGSFVAVPAELILRRNDATATRQVPTIAPHVPAR